MITQQVCLTNFHELNAFLVGGTDAPTETIATTCQEFVRAAPPEIDVAEHAEMASSFHDIGAVTFYLLGVPWRISGFDPLAESERMCALHEWMGDDGPFRVTAERSFIQARRPE